MGHGKGRVHALWGAGQGLPPSSSSGMQCVFTALWFPVPLRKSFFPGLEELSWPSLLRTSPLPQLELLGIKGQWLKRGLWKSKGTEPEGSIEDI